VQEYARLYAALFRTVLSVPVGLLGFRQQHPLIFFLGNWVPVLWVGVVLALGRADWASLAWWMFVGCAADTVTRWARLLVRRAVLAVDAQHAGGVLAHAQAVFQFLEIFLPESICVEVLGDGMERIHHMIRQRRPRWHVYGRVGATSFWAVIHSVGEFLRSARGK
jgi:hypothetical protein